MLERLIGNRTQTGLCFLRIALSVIFFAHGAQQLLGMFGGDGLAATAEKFAKVVYFPEMTVWIVGGGELIGSLALFIGLLTREASILLSLFVLGSLYLIHLDNGFFIQNNGYEYHLLLITGCLCLAFGGGGSGSMDKALFPHERWTFIKDPNKIKLLPPED